MTPKTEGVAYPIRIVISVQNDRPILELRKTISDPEIIKQVLTSAFQNKPIILQPSFSDRFRAMNALLEKGIIYKADDDNYYFTF